MSRTPICADCGEILPDEWGRCLYGAFDEILCLPCAAERPEPRPAAPPMRFSQPVQSERDLGALEMIRRLFHEFYGGNDD